MVKLKIKVGPKGQVLIPKIFREKYGISGNSSAILEPTPEGVLIKGRPSPEELMERLEKHVDKVRSLGLPCPKLGDLKGVCLEVEFEGASL